MIENGANIHAYDSAALRIASKNGHLSVVQYLIENGANVVIHAQDDNALRSAELEGPLSVVISMIYMIYMIYMSTYMVIALILKMSKY